ncbi:MAG: hypothetical protein J0665_14530 [Deltaproteobacteria bacterium]|nr:hypothetical protein [Deltaproteobacteria bacterium]
MHNYIKTILKKSDGLLCFIELLMRQFNRISYLQVRWLEQNFVIFSKIQNKRRFNKFDTSPNPFGINSQNNPHVYNLLIGFRNSKSLTDFEIHTVLLLFSREKFSKVEKNEFNNFLVSINFCFMMESLDKTKDELIELSKSNRLKYIAALESCEFLDLLSRSVKMPKKLNGEDALRNIRKLFCELRRLLNKHVIEPNETENVF